jgi:hypothetical protein|tara:strand:+ start:882 stop:1157 length:276 start_codon:yes stop_codon:yes gene_type:complete
MDDKLVGERLARIETALESIHSALDQCRVDLADHGQQEDEREIRVQSELDTLSRDFAMLKGGGKVAIWMASGFAALSLGAFAIGQWVANIK